MNVYLQVKVWEIPPHGLFKNMTVAWKELQGHSRRVGLIEWHPTANNILFSTAYDYKVKSSPLCPNTISRHPSVSQCSRTGLNYLKAMHSYDKDHTQLHKKKKRKEIEGGWPAKILKAWIFVTKKTK